MKLSFGCNLLLLLTTYTPHSLALHEHHKRMGTLVGEEGIKITTSLHMPPEHSPLSQGPKDASGTFDHVSSDGRLPHDPSTTTENTHQPHDSFNEPPLVNVHGEPLPPYYPPPIINDFVPPRPLFHTVRLILNGAWRKLAYSFERFFAIFSSKKPTRMSSYAEEFEETFRNLHANNLDPLVNTVLEKIFPPSVASEAERTALKEEIIEQLEDVRDFLESSQTIKKELAENYKEIQAELHPIASHTKQASPSAKQELTESHKEIEAEPHTTASHTKANNPDQVRRIGTLAATYRSRQLIDAQTTIARRQHHSLSYLYQFHGILGPQNIFGIMVENLLRDFVRANRLSSEFDADMFIQDIIKLEKGFKSALNHADDYHAALKQGHPLPTPTTDFDVISSQFDQKYSSLLGGSDGVDLLVKDILKSDVHKALRSDSSRPTDTTGYLLGLIEPLGIGRDPDKILMKEFPTDKLGISNQPIVMNRLTQISERVLNDAHNHLLVASHSIELKKNLMRLLTPEGYEAFVTALKKPTPETKPEVVQQLTSQGHEALVTELKAPPPPTQPA